MSVPKHFYTMTKAAKLAGKNRSTIQRQIKAGKISATRDEHDQWRIDPAEFHRMYPLKADNDQASEEGTQQRKPDAMQQGAAADSKELIATLRGMVETLERNNRREVEYLNQTIEDLRERLDKESSQNRALTAMLTDQRENKDEAPSAKRSGFFGLFSASK